jgi:hypothetical protein
MEFKAFKQVLIDTVAEVQGCKSMELIGYAAEKMGEEFARHDFMQALQEAIDEGDIEEVEYILPQLDFRIKSFLLPKNTQIFLGSSPDDKENDVKV